jgi:hypothetical protein
MAVNLLLSLLRGPNEPSPRTGAAPMGSPMGWTLVGLISTLISLFLHYGHVTDHPFSCIDAPSSGRSMYSKRARLFAENVRNPISSRSDARVVVFADSRSTSSSFASRLGRLDDTIAYTEVINFPVPRESKRITRDILRISSRKLMPEACGARQ